jgi:hypothetical protein
MAELRDMAIDFGTAVLPGLASAVRDVDQAFKDASGDNAGLKKLGEAIGNQVGNFGYLSRALATFSGEVQEGGGGIPGEALRTAKRTSWLGRMMFRANQALVRAPIEWLFTRQAEKDAARQMADSDARAMGPPRPRGFQPPQPEEGWTFGKIWEAVKQRADELEKLFLTPEVEKAWGDIDEQLTIEKMTGETSKLSDALKKLGIDSALTFGVAFSGNAKRGTEIVRILTRQLEEAAREEEKRAEDAAEAADKLADKLEEQKSIWQQINDDIRDFKLAEEMRTAARELDQVEDGIRDIEDAIDDMIDASRGLVPVTKLAALINDPRERRKVRKQLDEDEKFEVKMRALQRGERPFLTPRDKVRLRELAELGRKQERQEGVRENVEADVDRLEGQEGDNREADRKRRQREAIERARKIAIEAAKLREQATAQPNQGDDSWLWDIRERKIDGPADVIASENKRVEASPVVVPVETASAPAVRQPLAPSPVVVPVETAPAPAIVPPPAPEPVVVPIQTILENRLRLPRMRKADLDKRRDDQRQERETKATQNKLQDLNKRGFERDDNGAWRDKWGRPAGERAREMLDAQEVARNVAPGVGDAANANQNDIDRTSSKMLARLEGIERDIAILTQIAKGE